MSVRGPIYYRLNDDNTGPELLLEVFRERGWFPWDESTDSCDEKETWHLWWRHGFHSNVYRKLHGYQFVSHIPKGNGLCRKDSLARSLQQMKKTFANAYDFFPTTFLLPCDYTKLVAEYTRNLYYTYPNHSPSSLSPPADKRVRVSHRDPHGGSHPVKKDPNVWICKPTMSSQGRGITIFEDVHQLSYCDSAVAQRYVYNPLLVGGYKCDLRLYILVTSFIPLTVYVYKEGIARFGTEKYNLNALDRPCSHLTNTSLNKISPGYKLEKERVGSGCKWSLRQFRRHLISSGYSDWLLWQKVNVLITLTLLAQIGRMQSDATVPIPAADNCFELYGFDILVDENLTPWLLEVNRCPSLSYDCDVDRLVKKPMLHHLFDLVGVPRVSQPIETALNVPYPLETFQYKRKKYHSFEEDSISSTDDTVENIGVDINENDVNTYCRNQCETETKRQNACEECHSFCTVDDCNLSTQIREFKVRKINKPPCLDNLCDSCKVKLQKYIKSKKIGGTVIRNKSYRKQIGLENARKILHNSKSSNLVQSSFLSVSNSDLPSGCGYQLSRYSNIEKKYRCNPLRFQSDGIHESISPKAKTPKMAEEVTPETYYPVAFSSSFQRLRKQLLAVNLGPTRNRSVRWQPSFEQHKKVDSRGGPNSCGGWIKTFPFNSASMHAARRPMQMKNAIAEVYKYRRNCEKIVNNFDVHRKHKTKNYISSSGMVCDTTSTNWSSPPTNLSTNRASPPSNPSTSRTSPPANPSTNKTTPPENLSTNKTSPPANPSTNRTYSPATPSTNRTSSPANPSTNRTSPPANLSTNRTSPPANLSTNRTSPPANPSTNRTSPTANPSINRTSPPANPSSNRTYSLANLSTNRASPPANPSINRTLPPANPIANRRSSCDFKATELLDEMYAENLQSTIWRDHKIWTPRI